MPISLDLYTKNVVYYCVIPCLVSAHHIRCQYNIQHKPYTSQVLFFFLFKAGERVCASVIQYYDSMTYNNI